MVGMRDVRAMGRVARVDDRDDGRPKTCVAQRWRGKATFDESKRVADGQTFTKMLCATKRNSKNMTRIACRILMSVLLLYSAISEMAFAENSRPTVCSDHHNLIRLDNVGLAAAKPCDFLGFSFLLGLGIESIDYDGPLIYPGYDFYPFFRYFLKERGNKTNIPSQDELGMLIGAMPSMPKPFEVGSNERAAIYQLFFIGSFWEANTNRLYKSQEVVSSTFESLLQLTTLENFSEVKCFVKYDIPTMQMDEIKKSRQFLLCKEKSQ